MKNDLDKKTESPLYPAERALRDDLNTDLKTKGLSVRHRLYDVRDIFHERDVSEGQNRISLAEGGCFMPPPNSVLEKFIDAAINDLSTSLQIYPQNTVYQPFMDRIWDYFTTDCAIPLNSDNHGIAIGYGSSHLFDMFLSAVTNAGDYILLPESYYHGFSEWPAKWGGIPVCIKTSAKNGYKLTAVDLHVFFKEHPQLIGKNACIFISNPTTTGAVYRQDEAKALAEALEHYDLIAFCDEVFIDSCYSRDNRLSLAALPALADRVITAGSGSKSRSVADIRIGWASGPRQIIDKMIWHMEHSFIELPLYLQKIGLAILDMDDTFLATSTAFYQDRVKLLTNLTEHANKRLHMRFGGFDTNWIKITNTPAAGCYLSLDFSAFKGFKTPEGDILNRSEDLCRYFYHHKHMCADTEDILHGVCLSCGYSKGHDGLNIYIAFGQPGYDHANTLSADERHRHMLAYTLQKLAKTPLSATQISGISNMLGYDDTPAKPDWHSANEAGKQMLVDAFDRITCALQMCTPG